MTQLARLTARYRPAPPRTPEGAPRRWVSLAVAGAVLVIFAVLPFCGFSLPWVLPSSVDIVNSTGTLSVLALCFVFAGVAVGFDVLFGYTGLLSFGQVLYFAAGVYLLDIALSVWHWALIPAIARGADCKKAPRAVRP